MRSSRMFLGFTLVTALTLFSSCRESAVDFGGEVGEDYTLSFSSESLSIQEDFEVTLNGRPVRSVAMEIRGPNGDATEACREKSSPNVSTKTYRCYVDVVGEYTFTLTAQPFSGPEVQITGRARIGNSHRFTLEMSQGDKVVQMNQAGTLGGAPGGSLNFFSDSPIRFRFKDGGGYATVIFADGSRHQGAEFSKRFGEAGPQLFRVEMARVRRDFTFVVECPVNTYPPVVIDAVNVSLLPNAGYQYNLVVGQGNLIAFQMDVNGDRTMDTSWVRGSSLRAFSLLTGANRPLTVFAMDACGGVHSSTVTAELPPSSLPGGVGYLWANIEGVGNGDPAANVEHFFGQSLSNVHPSEKPYDFSPARRIQAGGDAWRVDVEQNRYAEGDDDRHGAHIGFFIPSSLIPETEGTRNGIVHVDAKALSYETASEGDVVRGPTYENLEAFDMEVTVTKIKETEGPCTSSGKTKDYQIKIEARWLDAISLTAKDDGATPRLIRMKGKLAVYYAKQEREDCIPAPTCVLRPQGSYTGSASAPQWYDHNTYEGVMAGLKIETDGQVSSVTLNGQPATAGMHYFTPAAAGPMSFAATVSGPGGATNCSTAIEVLRNPGSSCAVQLSAQETIVGQSVYARILPYHLPINGGTASNVRLNGQSVPLGEWVSFPVTALGDFTMSGGFTSGDGDIATCSGGGKGVPPPGGSCVISGQSIIRLSDYFSVQVSNAGYHGGSWTGNFEGHSLDSSSSTTKLIEKAPGNYVLRASITFADSTTASCEKTVEVRPAPFGCVVYQNGTMYDGMPGNVSLSVSNADKHQGVVEAKINDADVMGSYTRSLTLPAGSHPLSGFVRAGDGSTFLCSGTAQVVAKPALGCVISSSSGSQALANTPVTFQIAPQNLQFYGGSVTKAEIGSRSDSAFNYPMADVTSTLSRTVTPTAAGQLKMMGRIQAGGQSVECGGGGGGDVLIVVPDVPPPPTLLCEAPRVVNAATGLSLVGREVYVPEGGMQIRVTYRAQGPSDQVARLERPNAAPVDVNLPAGGAMGEWSYTQTIQPGFLNATFSVTAGFGTSGAQYCPSAVSFRVVN